ncbi:MAG TPA: LD-carboxypeptidase, partial [Candidatus Acetothermia bacterium]|nr:LD-carboxypeptidase [Candidatus Acetothermia bacterium]
ERVNELNELNELIRNPEVRCIMSTIGGTNSNSLLPYIDYDALIKDPKILIGYSDVIAILLAVHAKTGLITFYGPALVASFGELGPLVDMTHASFTEMLVNPASAPFTYSMPNFWSDEFINWEEQERPKQQRENQWLTVYPSKARGRVIGGNLNTMQGFWGSQYMPAVESGDILFIEDSMKDAATLERSFSFLKVNGVFDKVSGIILGKHELFKDRGTGVRPYQILQEVLDGQELPFLADFDCSHTHPMFTLPIGVEIELDATEKTVTILSDWCRSGM